MSDPVSAAVAPVATPARPWSLPPVGDNPSTDRQGTTPGSFARRGAVGSAYAYASADTPGMPAPSPFTAWDFLPDAWQTFVVPAEDDVDVDPGDADSKVVRIAEPDGSTRVVVYPRGFAPVTQLESARVGIVTPEMKRVALREPHLTPEQIRAEVAAGRMIVPANVVHLKHNLEPMAIGRASLTKINANMGASPVSSGTDEEVEKLKWAEKWGADTVMDLSTGGDLNACRDAIVKASTVPIGTVPIYSMIIGRKIEELTVEMILAELESQAAQGVDYFTIHAGVLREHLPMVRKRLIGIVSRGGSLLAKWMIVHHQQNPMYTAFEQICAVMRRYDVSFSLGDGLRPGGLADATDEAQLAELATLGELTERAWKQGVQVMVEGPGHVPFDQIEFNMKLQRRLCHGAPFYVLGPLVTDVFPGYDHITSCIGATSAGFHGASMLCYVTPKEHLGLPKKDDVKQGCVAYKIAAHAADVALGIPGSRDRDDELTKARAALNWQKHFDLSFDPDLARAYHDEDLEVDTDFCAMCGHDWCSVRISKEITDFFSGKDEASQPTKKAIASPGVTAAGADVLKQRGNLSQEEIMRLAHKGKKADCHSDKVTDAEAAKGVQKLVTLNTLKAHGVVVNESGL
jgi:phosphomethylpyrimidine synthase